MFAGGKARPEPTLPPVMFMQQRMGRMMAAEMTPAQIAGAERMASVVRAHRESEQITPKQIPFG